MKRLRTWLVLLLTVTVPVSASASVMNMSGCERMGDVALHATHHDGHPGCKGHGLQGKASKTATEKHGHGNVCPGGCCCISHSCSSASGFTAAFFPSDFGFAPQQDVSGMQSSHLAAAHRLSLFRPPISLI